MGLLDPPITLQKATDKGNTTTNDIEFLSGANPVIRSSNGTSFRVVVSNTGELDVEGAGVVNTYSFTGAFSISRQLNSFSEYAIRVRRGSDNTEQDIGFSNGFLDTAALLSFVGAESAYVTTIYDQSGSSNNWVQSTAGNQPLIVDSGDLVTGSNGLAALDVSAGNFMTGSGLDVQSMFVVAEPSSNSLGNFLSDDDGTPYLRYTNTAITYRTSSFDPFSIPAAAGVTLISLIAAGESNPRSVSVWKNGTASSSNPNSLNLMEGANMLFKGLGENYVGKFQELLISNDATDNRENIENNINTAYAIF